MSIHDIFSNCADMAPTAEETRANRARLFGNLNANQLYSGLLPQSTIDAMNSHLPANGKTKAKTQKKNKKKKVVTNSTRGKKKIGVKKSAMKKLTASAKDGELRFKSDGSIDKRCKAYKAQMKNGKKIKDKIMKKNKTKTVKTVKMKKPAIKRKVSDSMKRYVAADQDWKCGHCGMRLPASFEIDHIIALCNGGTNDRSNLVALCRNCHGEKTIQERLFK